MSDGHDDRARGFTAFPPRKGGRARGQSWWGRAWVESMEGNWPEEEPLKNGRSFARSGRLGPLTVCAGRVAAQAHGGVDEPHTVSLELPELDDDQWDALWERTADRPAETDALLAGELPPGLLEAAEDARLGLLPGYGELEPDCDCDCDEPDHPCAHAVALGYQFSWLLDKEPQLLLLVRGREWPQALEELKSVLLVRAMTDAAEDEAGEEDDKGAEGDEDDEGAEGDEHLGGQAVGPVGGTHAAETYARPVTPLPALPPLPEPPDRSTEVTGIEADPLERLVADAAVRARELLAYTLSLTGEPPRSLDVWQDSVRIAATHPDPRVPQRLRDSCGRPDELDRAAEAWRFGGSAGLKVLEQTWEPERSDVTRARMALSAGWEDDELPELVVRDNHWTLSGRGLQLRYGRDGRWYPYQERSGTWWPSGPPAHDPALVLAELLGG